MAYSILYTAMALEARDARFGLEAEKTVRSETVRLNRLKVIDTLSRYQEIMPPDIWESSMQKINNAYAEFLQPTESLPAKSAFLIHSRRSSRSHQELDDAARCFPLFAPEYGIDDETVDTVWNMLPPFEVGRIEGTLPNGEQIDCALISVPITPTQLEQASGPGARIKYAFPRIEMATDFAQQKGATVIGLGETLASLTTHGQKLKNKFPNMEIATGHAFTTYFMLEWVKEAAKAKDAELSSAAVVVIGANGSIGSAMVDLLIDEGVSELYLHDRENSIGALEKKAALLVTEYPWLEDKVHVSGGNEALADACKGSNIILVASSAPEPFIKAEHLRDGTIIINDSQPPGITSEEAEKAQSVTWWVTGKLPDGVTDTFNSGLVDGAEWTCALEVVAKSGIHSLNLDTVGPVTQERVKKVEDIVKTLGMGLPAPQSYGRVIPLDVFMSSHIK